MNAWAGQVSKEIQMVQRSMPEIAVEREGPMVWIIHNMPGGEWTVFGIFLFGLASLGWLKFRKQIQGIVWRLVKDRIQKPKGDA